MPSGLSRYRQSPRFEVPLTLRHFSGRFSGRPVLLGEAFCDEIKITSSTRYHDLYQELQKRAAKSISFKRGAKHSDISGTVWVEWWGEDHVVLPENWVSETQHYLGINGSRLKFEFHVIDDKHPLSSKSKRFKDKLKGWTNGLLCGDASNDGSGDESIHEFVPLEDLVRAHAMLYQ